MGIFMESQTYKVVFDEITKYRDNLLDSSRRNKFLNFTTSKYKSIKIVGENMLDLYDTLVLKEHKMQFKAHEDLDADNLDVIVPELDNSWSLDEKLDYDDSYITTDDDEKTLSNKLKKLYRDYKSTIDEKGFNSLYLALGFLEWMDSSYHNKKSRAPLILVPLTLTKSYNSYKLSWNFEDVKFNLTLKYVLADMNIILPTFENLNSKEDIKEYLESVEKVISHRSNWKVTTDIYVSIFSFKKLAMYEDLNPDKWNLQKNNISKLYFNNPDNDAVARVLDYSDNYLSLSNYNVLDADSSQQEVIQNIKNGIDLVVEGPPGTGKSQTIVNVIAELLALGKSVLFVSEKKVALDVVKNRLDNVGLGDMCLELHGENYNKKAFIIELARTLNITPKMVDYGNLYNHLDDVKKELTSYSNIIYDEFGQTGHSPYDFIGMYMEYEKIYDNIDKDILDVHIAYISDITPEEYDKIIDNLNKIAQQYKIIGNVKDNQWNKTDIGRVNIENLEGVRGDLEVVCFESQNLYNKINYIAEQVDAHPSNKNTVNEIIEYLTLLNGNISNIEYKNLMNSIIEDIEEYQEKHNEVKIDDNINYRKVYERYNEINNRLEHSPFKSEYVFNGQLEEKLISLKKTHEAIVNNPLSHLISDKYLNEKILLFEKYKNASLIRLINRDYDNLRNNLRGYYSSQCSDEQIYDDLLRMKQYQLNYANLRNEINNYCKAAMNYSQLFEQYTKIKSLINYLYKLKGQIGCSEYSIIEFEQYLKEAVKLQSKREIIQRQDKNARYLFGDSWNSTQSDTKKLRKKLEIFDEIEELIKKGFYSDATLEYMRNIDKNEYKKLINEVDKIREDLEHSYEKLNKILSIKKSKPFNKIRYHELTQLNLTYKKFLDNMDNINDYRIFDKYTNEYSNIHTLDLIEKVKQDKIKPDKIVETFKVNYVKEALRNIFYDPTLNQFNYSIHNYNIEKYQELDKKSLLYNRQRIRRKVLERQPDIRSSLKRDSPLGTVSREIGKKSKHMAIRKFLHKTSDIITQIKPCFMMSPMSIAQYLDSEKYESYFDYVIFDEASQLKIEDAFGALLRGKNYVIMGDTKQLPPTTFFDSSVEADDDEDEIYSAVGIESILEHAKITLETKMLKWHYRSRHDSLIAVSNKEFYNNELYVYPSSTKSTEDLGLKLVYNPDTIYEKGRSASNPQEAEEILDYLFELLKKYGDTKTIGIATFSKKQQNLIDDKLQERLEDDDTFSSYFEDKKNKFFIKNLENIQGDEKDIILISMGYGFDEDHKISMNFGPVNKDGGERRLNVLISRAKEQCIVFSNFKAHDMKIEKTTPQGLKSLRTFLYYAEKGEFPQNNDIDDYSEARFEQYVFDTLTEHGYNVDMKVGTAGYKIDLAVVDPTDEDEYILAIECDGQSYHSSNSVRDRDRLRQQILENLGWNFYRVWSTDWYQNEKEATKRLLDKLEEVTKLKSK